MRYLDQYLRITAEKFEKELARVAFTDSQAKLYSENAGILQILADIKSGALVPPSKVFEPYDLWFFPDSKYGEWAPRMMYEKGEKALFTACASLSNVLGCRNDLDFADHCRLIGYVFPDGWPNDPVLYQQTVEQEKLLATKEIVERQESLLNRILHSWAKKR